jgi:hypothetical protein
MAAKTPSKTRKTTAKAKKDLSLPLEKTNFLIIGAGIVVLIIGYILVLGYCVIIPYGILMKPKKTGSNIQQSEGETVQASPENVSSNIKTK